MNNGYIQNRKKEGKKQRKKDPRRKLSKKNGPTLPPYPRKNQGYLKTHRPVDSTIHEKGKKGKGKGKKKGLIFC